MSAKVSPQETLRCACPAWTTERECVRLRYPHGTGGPYDDLCDCLCHGEDDEDEGDDL